MADLKQQPHGRVERDALVAGQSQDLVVVHDGVERLDPHGVDVSVQHDPFGPVPCHAGQISHTHREQTWSGGWGGWGVDE